MKPPQVFKPKLLLCEGKDEVEFFSALLKHLNRSDVQIESVGGKHFFAPNIAALATDPKLSQVTDILIVRDADFTQAGAGFASTWQSVTDALGRNGLPVPTAHATFVPGPPRVAAFIMPDGQSDGMLETLCAAAVQADPATSCVVGYFTCLQLQTNFTHLARNQDKAFTRAFLASRPEPDRKLGEAAQAGYWPWNSLAFAPLIGLLSQL